MQEGQLPLSSLCTYLPWHPRFTFWSTFLKNHSIMPFGVFLVHVDFHLQLNSECVIWDISAGSNHSIFLMDHADMKDSRPDVFYVGKHPW